MSTLEEVQKYFQVPAVTQFCSGIRYKYNFPHFDVEDLECALIPKNFNDFLTMENIMIKLLSICSGVKDVGHNNWDSVLQGVISKKWPNVGLKKPLIDYTRAEFHDLPLQNKVEILYALCHYCLDADCNLANDIDLRCWRGDFLGTDHGNFCYWYFNDVRLYKEDRSIFDESCPSTRKKSPIVNNPSRWSVACFTKDDWDILKNRLKGKKYHVNKQLLEAIEERELCCAAAVVEKERHLKKVAVSLCPRRISSRIDQVRKRRMIELERAAEIAENERCIKEAKELKRREVEEKEKRAKEMKDRAKRLKERHKTFDARVTRATYKDFRTLFLEGADPSIVDALTDISVNGNQYASSADENGLDIESSDSNEATTPSENSESDTVAPADITVNGRPCISSDKAKDSESGSNIEVLVKITPCDDQENVDSPRRKISSREWLDSFLIMDELSELGKKRDVCAASKGNVPASVESPSEKHHNEKSCDMQPSCSGQKHAAQNHEKRTSQSQVQISATEEKFCNRSKAIKTTVEKKKYFGKRSHSMKAFTEPDSDSDLMVRRNASSVTSSVPKNKHRLKKRKKLAEKSLNSASSSSLEGAGPSQKGSSDRRGPLKGTFSMTEKIVDDSDSSCELIKTTVKEKQRSVGDRCDVWVAEDPVFERPSQQDSNNILPASPQKSDDDSDSSAYEMELENDKNQIALKLTQNSIEERIVLRRKIENCQQFCSQGNSICKSTKGPMLKKSSDQDSIEIFSERSGYRKPVLKPKVEKLKLTRRAKKSVSFFH